MTQASLVEHFFMSHRNCICWAEKFGFFSFLCSVAVGRHVVTVSNMCHHLSDILALNPLDSSFDVCLKFECN